MRISSALAGLALLSTTLAGTLAAPSAQGADGPDGSDGGGTRLQQGSADRIALAADRYDTSERSVRERLEADPTIRLAGNGAAYFVDPPHADHAAPGRSPEAIFPLNQTFQLHSKPGSQRTIFLDFDGHTVSNTYWNTIPNGVGLPNGAHPAWDPDGNGAAFTDDEKAMIQDIWQRVAEDYAPFDVDVTTAEPALAAIDRSGAGDQQYGTRALITPSDEALDVICGGGCGGVAFLEAFGQYPGNNGYPDSHAEDQPAWVFPQALGDVPKNIAEATTHEVGHNLGLEHDGTTTEGYYTGADGWGPIMGVGYEQPIVQWSLSDYQGAKLGGPGDDSGSWQDSPDDLVAMANHGAVQRADDAANTHGSAGPLPATDPNLLSTGIIGSRTDVDVFALGSCTGNVSVDADPASVSPNLDIKLELLGPSGSVVDSDDPASDWDFFDYDVATGLDAQVSTNGAAGNYFVRVDGVGRGNPANGTGYTDYGSLGAYVLDVTGTCTPEDPSEEAPSAPRNLTGNQVGDGAVRLNWQAPADDGGSAITGYRVYRDGALVRELGANASSVDLQGVSVGSHSFGVAAVNAAGEGARADATVTVIGDDPGTTPGAPALGTPKAGRKGKPFTAVFPWSAPAADPAIERYEVVAYKQSATGWREIVREANIPAHWTGVKFTNKKRAFTIRIEVRACNSVGCGDWATSAAVRLR